MCIRSGRGRQAVRSRARETASGRQLHISGFQRVNAFAHRQQHFDILVRQDQRHVSRLGFE
jgi:hypothetical protein